MTTAHAVRAPRTREFASALPATAYTVAVCLITAVAAVLRFAHLGQVPTNPFYDAAIRTMSRSWHAFLFGALDPSASVSVDKPPVDLWLQVASVKLFGYSATALKLPQALAGTACVPVVCAIVRRGFGRGAGLAAAAAMAVMPVAVLTARSDTMDTAMCFLILVAMWLVVRATGSGRLPALVAAGAVAGLAFNVKLFEALLPLPAIALVWLAGAPVSWRRRIAGLAAAIAAMVVVSLAWIVPVALTPASQRPYPIGSTNGSIWNVVFVFNGTARLNGRPPGTPDTLPASSKVPARVAQAQRVRLGRHHDNKGPRRLLAGHSIGPWIGSELFPALVFGGLAALVGALAIVRARGFERHRRLQLALALGVGAWLALGYVFFSMTGAFHPRYFEAVSPAVAMALAIGVWTLARDGPARAALAALGLGLSVYYLTRIGTRTTLTQQMAPVIAAAAILAMAIVAWRRPRLALARDGAAVLALAALLVVPTGVSANVVHTRAFDSERSGAMPKDWPPRLNRYLSAHRDGTRYAFASIAPAKAAPMIILNPQPVLMLTSYRSRPLISVPELVARVRSGQVRYFLLGRRCTSRLTKNTAACPATARCQLVQDLAVEERRRRHAVNADDDGPRPGLTNEAANTRGLEIAAGRTVGLDHVGDRHGRIVSPNPQPGSAPFRSVAYAMLMQ